MPRQLPSPKGLINWIIAGLDLIDRKIKFTLAENGALPAEREGEPTKESLNYASIIRMMMPVFKLLSKYRIHCASVRKAHTWTKMNP